MGYPTTNSAKTTNLTTYASDVMHLHQRYARGENIADVDPTNKRTIATETRFKSGTFILHALTSTNEIKFISPVIGIDVQVGFPTTLVNTEANIVLFEKTSQPVQNKTINAALNIISNLDNENFKSNASLDWDIINKTGSVLGDIDNINLAGLVDNVSIRWNAGASEWQVFTALDAATTDLTDFGGVLTKTQQHPNTVYTDQANFYGNHLQTFPRGYLRLNDGDTHYVAFYLANVAGNYTISIPAITGSDTMAVLNLVNVFTQAQKVSITGSQPIILHRQDSSAGSGVGIAFNLQNSTPVETTYGYLFGVIADNTPAAESGNISFQTKSAGANAERMLLRYDNTLHLGLSGSRIIFDPAGITANRTYTFGNASGQVALLSLAQTFTAQQLFNTGSTIPMFVRRQVNAVGSELALAYGEMLDSTSTNTAYGRINIRIGVNTDGNETGYMDFWVYKNGASGQYMVLDGNTLSLGLSGSRAVLDASNINTLSKTFTFPNEAGAFLVDTATQSMSNKTITSPIINGTITTSGAALLIQRTAVASAAETITQWKMSDDATSYLQIDNASAVDGQFVPRITAYNNTNTTAPGFYLYSNIATANDSGNSNAVIVLDSRRANGTALTARPILDIRNMAVNIARFFPNATYFYNEFYIQPASGTNDFESLLDMRVSDSPSCYSRISNATSTNTVFVPLMTNYAAAAAVTSSHMAYHIRNMVLVANDSGTSPLMIIESRRSDGTIIASRPFLAIRNFNTDEYIFGVGYLDLTGNELQNAVIASSVTGIANANIASGAAIEVTKIAGFENMGTLDTGDVPTWDGTKWVASPPPGAGGGEANAGDNVGTGDAEIYKDKTGTTLNFKRLVEGTNITLTNDTDTVTIAATGGLQSVSNVGTEGISVFKQIASNVAQLKAIAAASNKVTVADDATANTVDIDIAEANLTIANMAGYNLLPLLASSNVFTAAQTVSVNTEIPFIIYRPVNTNGTRVGESFSARNSANAQISYAEIEGVIEDNTAGSEDGWISIQYRIAGSLTEWAYFYGKGIGFGGPGNEVFLSNAGVTSDIDITFPNATTKLLGETTGLKVKRDAITTTPVTATALQTVLNVDASGGNRTVNLPAVAGNDGLVYIIRKIDSSANTVTIDASGSETINGSLTMVLTAQYQVVILIANTSGTGSHWFTSPYSVERRGKSTATGNGSATSFNIPHGLGVDPHDAIPSCRTHTIATYTTNATNIVVTLTAAPANGASVIFDWSAVP